MNILNIINANLISKRELTAILDKYVNGDIFTTEELDNFYCVDEYKFICVFNRGGDCWTEEFNNLVSVYNYFNTPIDTDDLYKLEEKSKDLFLGYKR